MPELKPTELGDVGSLRCQCLGCMRGAMMNGSGWQMPFCRQHLTRLSRRTFNALSAVASKSVFDDDAVFKAAALVFAARLKLREKRGKRA